MDRSRSVALQAYETIRHAIISNALKPGQPLSEKELANSLRVSRTPAREALIRLAREGLVDIIPRHGTFVSPVRVEQVFEAHAIREALELKIVQLAAQRATAQDVHDLEDNIAKQKAALAEGDRHLFHEHDEVFHRLLARIAGLSRACDLINQVKVQLDRVRMLANQAVHQPEEAARSHETILSAVAANDPKAATVAMQMHLDSSMDAIKRIIRSEQAYFTAQAA